MAPSSPRVFRSRELTQKERAFTRWLIEHAGVSDEEKQRLLSQLTSATVAGMCGCGCASIDFAIAGVTSDPTAPLHPIGEFVAKDRQFGVFVFSKHAMLAGVEIYSLEDTDLPPEFPELDTLETTSREETRTQSDSKDVARPSS